MTSPDDGQFVAFVNVNKVNSQSHVDPNLTRGGNNCFVSGGAHILRKVKVKIHFQF